MSLDDLARRAGEDLRERAASGPTVAFREWRRRRGVRAVVLVVAGGLAAIFAISLGVVIGEDDPDLAIDISLPPDASTSTTLPVPPSTVAPPGPVVETGMLGAGWERLDFGHLTGGRYRMAAAWTGDRLFVWGGHVLASNEVPPATEFLQDGYLYRPATGEWTATGRPLGLCHLGLARAVPVEGGVIVHGSVSIGGELSCARAAFYDLETAAWTALDSELFAGVSSRSPLAYTGELLVAPAAGLAYDLDTGETHPIPRVPADSAAIPPGPVAHWTGSEVIVVGSGRTYSWVPGDPEWTEIEGPPIPTIARGSVMTDSGLLAVNYQMATAFRTGDGWSRPGDLPLRFYECLPEPVSAGGVPVVRMCSGIALWDEVGQHWMPIPLEDVTALDLGTLVGAGDAVYSVGRSLRRFEIVRGEGGTIELPATIPIGVMQLDVPDGWVHIASIAPTQDPEGFIPEDETVGVVFDRHHDATQCRVTSTNGGLPTLLDDFTAMETLRVDRPGRLRLSATHYVDRTSGAVALAFSEVALGDVVVVACHGPDPTILRDAATEFAVGLWSPWESPAAEMEQASLVVTPQAGPSGTVVTLYARGFPVGWSQWWLIDESGNEVVQIPSDFFPHDNPDFTLALAIDERVPPGTYRFAIDGRVVPGATFSKTVSLPRMELSYVLEASNHSNPIGTVGIENRDAAPVDLAGWTLEDEIVPRSSFVFPEDTVLQPGERIFVEYQLGPCPSPTEADFVVCADPPRRAVLWGSVALRATHGHLVDRHLISEPCPWSLQPEVPQCGYVLFDDPDQGLRFQVPADSGLPEDFGRWHVADLSLTSALVSPTEILSLGTYPLRRGGDTCAQIPENALEDLGPRDAFISIQRRAADRDPFILRPESFTYEWFDAQADAGGFWECLDRPDRAELYLRWGLFSEGDDVYFVTVALGQQAGDTIRAQQVLDILDGLEFGG